LKTSAKLGPEALKPHEAAIVACLGDGRGDVRAEVLKTLAKEVLKTLAKLDLEALKTYEAALVACLGDGNEHVRAEALKTFAKLEGLESDKAIIASLNEQIVVIVDAVKHAGSSVKSGLRTKLAMWSPLTLKGKGPHCSASNRVSKTGKQLTSSGFGVPPTHWGINKPQIRKFLEWCRQHPAWRDAMTAREMVEQIMKPEYNRRGLSVALGYNEQKPLPIKHLVSHSWDENVLQFLTDVLTINCADDEALFICFLSVYQGDVEEIDAQVTQGSKDISQGCFSRILHYVALQDGSQFVVPNETLKDNGQGLYSRLWCAWEIYNCIICGVPLHFHPPSKRTEPYLFGSIDIARFSAADGHCGPPSQWGGKDEIAIKAAIQSGAVGGWARVDKVLKDGCKFGLANDGGDDARSRDAALLESLDEGRIPMFRPR
jgi:hypothetical protein